MWSERALYWRLRCPSHLLAPNSSSSSDPSGGNGCTEGTNGSRCSRSDSGAANHSSVVVFPPRLVCPPPFSSPPSSSSSSISFSSPSLPLSPILFGCLNTYLFGPYLGGGHHQPGRRVRVAFCLMSRKYVAIKVRGEREGGAERGGGGETGKCVKSILVFSHTCVVYIDGDVCAFASGYLYS